MRIVFMGLGIAKIHQETITQELSNVSVKTLDDFRTRRLIRTDDFSIIFRVELRRQLGGIDQITEHHGELAAFRFGYTRFSWRKYTLWRLIVLGRKLCLCLDRR